MRPKIHDRKHIVRNKAESVRSSRERFSVDCQREFAEQIALVFLLNRGRISRIVHKPGQNNRAIREAQAEGIAQLHGGSLPTEKDGVRHQAGDILRR